jgi:hypothetical protein
VSTRSCSDSELAKVVLFSEKTETTSLYRGLSAAFKDRLLLLQVNKKDKELGATALSDAPGCAFHQKSLM